jgi:archaellum component FlaG (FlaF/FlaG flagellin family)
MINKAIAIASVLVTAALAGIFSTSAYASVAGDESATNTEQEIAQQNDGSGESTNKIDIYIIYRNREFQK